MPALDRNDQFTCGSCRTSVRKKNLSRHKSRCSGGTLYWSKCPIFLTESKYDLNYHFAKKHSVPGPSITYKCKLCHAEFSGFYALRQHKNTQHGTQIGFGAKYGGYSGRYWRSKIERRIGILQTLFDRYWKGEWKTQSLQLCNVILRHFFVQR